MKTHVVGLVAQMHVGKDTLADHLIKDHTPFKRLAFADKLKEMVDLLSLPKTRASFQHVGQGMRQEDPDVWVRPVEEQIIESSVASKFVITDVRYHNEMEMIERFGGTVIVLTATNEERWERYQTSDKFDPNKTRETWDQEQVHETEDFARVYSNPNFPKTGETRLTLKAHHKVSTSGLTDIEVFGKVVRLLAHLGVI